MTRAWQAEDAAIAAIHRELQALARRYMAREYPGHTLQATALVHEAFLRLRSQLPTAKEDPARFCLAAAEAMRRILIDHARRKDSLRRGGDLRRLPLDLAEVADIGGEEASAVDEAITKLGQHSARASAVVRLRFFVGLREHEVARVLGLSERTVRREWAFARAWLFRELHDDPESARPTREAPRHG